jgi:RNA polymerase sigma factor (sigma-70 family)
VTSLETLERVYRRERPRLLARFRHFPVEDVEDALHDAYVIARRACREESEPSVSGFLATSMRYLLRRHFVRGEHRFVDRRGDHSDDLDCVDPRGASPDERLLQDEAFGMIVRALVELPADHRRVVLLRDLLDFSPQDVQGFEGISQRQYARRLERGHRRLRDELLGTEA